MYADSSTLVGILLDENDRDNLIERLMAATARFTSPLTMLETMIALAAKTRDRENAPRQVRQLLNVLEIKLAPIDESCVDGLAYAFTHYHRGSGSPAKLNMGDCISYAVAKSRGLQLLCKGDDFKHTDLA